MLFLIRMQLGLLTPPFGLLLFTMKGVAPRSISMHRGIWQPMPYIVMSLPILDPDLPSAGNRDLASGGAEQMISAFGSRG